VQPMGSSPVPSRGNQPAPRPYFPCAPLVWEIRGGTEVAMRERGSEHGVRSSGAVHLAAERKRKVCAAHGEQPRTLVWRPARPPPVLPMRRSGQARTA